MDIHSIVAIIRRDRLEEVEKRLSEAGVAGVSVSRVKGYGEYHDFFARDWMVEEVRVEVFAPQDEVERIVSAIMAAAHTGVQGDGIVAVMPVEKFYSIRTGTEATPNRFRRLETNR